MKVKTTCPKRKRLGSFYEVTVPYRFVRGLITDEPNWFRSEKQVLKYIMFLNLMNQDKPWDYSLSQDSLEYVIRQKFEYAYPVKEESK